MAVIAIEPEIKAPFFLKLTSLMSQYNTKGPICLVYVLKLLINVTRAIGCTYFTLCGPICNCFLNGFDSKETSVCYYFFQSQLPIPGS